MCDPVTALPLKCLQTHVVPREGVPALIAHHLYALHLELCRPVRMSKDPISDLRPRARSRVAQQIRTKRRPDWAVFVLGTGRSGHQRSVMRHDEDFCVRLTTMNLLL